MKNISKIRYFFLHKASISILAGIILFSAGLVLGGLLQPVDDAAAEQFGSSPESGVDSRLKTAYDHLVGLNYGSDPVDDWNNDWGTMWNRIMAAASWTPDGSATTAQVMVGETFYASGRQIQTGSYDPTAMYEAMAFQSIPSDEHGNGEWIETSDGGALASVSLRGTTIRLESNKVFIDQRTGLYWSDSSFGGPSNNAFATTEGQTNRVNPGENYCNFNSPGDANEWCNTAGTGVSANELCLNLSLDANGDGTPETDWRLPTQKELFVAFANGAAANLPNVNRYYWSSTQPSTHRANFVALDTGYASDDGKSSSWNWARCVR